LLIGDWKTEIPQPIFFNDALEALFRNFHKLKGGKRGEKLENVIK
jgi:hypothetical protein